jgi:two-component system phosphate regulon sensor histidine kinase PhoR
MKRRHSFFLRVVAAGLITAGLIALLSSWITYHALNAQFRRTTRAEQHRTLGAVRAALEAAWPLPPDDLAARAGAIAAELGQADSHLTIVAADGRALWDSRHSPPPIHNYLSGGHPTIRAVLEGRPVAVDLRPDPRRAARQIRHLALPIRSEGRVRAAIRLGQPAGSLAEPATFLSGALGGAMLIGAVASMAGGGVLLWTWVLPLRRILRHTKQIAEGDLSGRLSETGSGDLQRLAGLLNQVRNDFAWQIEAVREQRGHLQAVVANLREGVIALDGRQNVLLINQAAVDLVGPRVADPIGMHIQALVRNAEITAMVGELETRERVRSELELPVGGRRRTLEVQAARVRSSSSEGVSSLVVVRDITQLARMATVKAEFVANASHELRTPIATLRAAVDSMSDDPDDAGQYVQILDRNLKRLEEMTNDLLDLHLVEQGRSRLRLQEVELGDLVAWVNTQFAPKASGKGVTLLAEAARPHATVRTDQRLAHLIFQNLVDNGIKFTPAGGEVHCHLKPDGEGWSLRVADTGCGIDPDLQDRVFERFYQADASRAGTRGTGLGLAIVKYAVERLGGTLCLQSAPGKGTTISVHLPQPV